MKKLLASLLCVAMIVCFMPTMAFAETEAVAQVGETTYNSFREAQAAALNELKTNDSVEIKLLKDTSTATFSDLSGAKTLVLDLNDKTLEVNQLQSIQVTDGASLIIKNGNLTNFKLRDGTGAFFIVTSNSSVIVKNTTIDTNGSALWPKGDAALVKVEDNSHIKAGVYAVATNAATVDNYNVKIELSDSTLETPYGFQNRDGDCCAVFINVECKLNIDNCIIKSGRQGLAVRAGNATIENSEIINECTYSNKPQYYGENATWGSGDEVPMAGILVGNYVKNGSAKAYNADAVATLINTKISVADNNVSTVYIADNATYKAQLTLGKGCDVQGAFTNITKKIDSAIVITGGTYSVAPTKYVSDGYSTLSNADSTLYIVAETANVQDNKLIGGTYKTNVKDFIADSVKQYKKGDEFVVSATAPAHSDGKNTWIEDKENGYYTETYVSYSSGSTTTDNVTNKSENTTTGEAASTTADINASTTTKADGTKTTTATVDNTTAGKIVDKAVANKSEEVVVDATSTAAAPAAGTTTEVALPEKTVQDLAAKTDANVTIKTDAASVALNKEAVDAVAAQAGTTGTVKLVVETVKTDADIHQVELKLVTSNGAVTDFKGGNVAVTVKLDAALNAKDVVCVYIDDNGVYHKVNGQKNADGTYTFTTGHFSTYAVMSTEEAEKVFAQQDAKAADLTKALKLQARSVKTSKGNIKVALQANADDIKALEDLGYTVKYKYYRSTVKAATYTAKVEKTEKTYTNTTGKKGTRYYYKARVMVYGADGQLAAKTALNQCKYACRIK